MHAFTYNLQWVKAIRNVKNVGDERYTKINTSIYVYIHSISYTVSTRMSGHNDQFLNEVLQCQKQLTIHINHFTAYVPCS